MLNAGDTARSCIACKYFRKLSKSRMWKAYKNVKHSVETAAKKLRGALRTIRCRDKNVVTLLQKIDRLKAKNQFLKKESFEQEVSTTCLLHTILLNLP